MQLVNVAQVHFLPVDLVLVEVLKWKIEIFKCLCLLEWNICTSWQLENVEVLELRIEVIF